MHSSLRKKCPNSELFWSAFCLIWTEYGACGSVSRSTLHLLIFAFSLVLNIPTFTMWRCPVSNISWVYTKSCVQFSKIFLMIRIKLVQNSDWMVSKRPDHRNTWGLRFQLMYLSLMNVFWSTALDAVFKFVNWD